MPRWILMTARRVVGAVLGLLLIGLIGLVGTIQVAQHLGYSPYVIHGASMGPHIALGSVVLVESVDPAGIGLDDVITVKTDKGLVFTHRVVAIVDSGGERQFQTRGDANPTPDPQLIPAATVAGRVAMSIPLAGYAIAMLDLPSGVVSIVSLLAALLLLFWLLEDLDPRLPAAFQAALHPDGNPATT